MLHVIQERLSRTAAIVRTYGFLGIGEFVERLLNLGIQWVVVVVPSEQDKGVTRPIIRTLDPSRVVMIEQWFERGGQAWSGMLNAGLDFTEGRIKPDFVLTVSNTVQLEASHLDQLCIEMTLPEVMVAGASFKGVGKSGEEVPLGLSYNHHYRNTLALYRAEAFRLHNMTRRFDESSDGKGGMEDLVMKRMIERHGRRKVAESVVEVPLLVHTHRTPEEQVKYEALMERGIQDAEFRADHLAFLDH